MDCLNAKDVQLATGDPCKCLGCSAILNKYSLIETNPLDGKQTWKCEFCNFFNSVHLEPEEKPEKETVSYILEPAKPKEKPTPTDVTMVEEEEKKGDSSEPQHAKDISIVYCVDVSGSMQGTRLNCVKATILNQLEDMKKKYPLRKVGIVTFSDDIKVVGDGTAPVLNADSNTFNDYNALLKNGKTFADTQLSKPISETFESLYAKVKSLGTEGSTALGPGMLTSIALAGEGSLGS